MTWSIKRNDRDPSYTAQLLENGSPLPGLAGASVRFIMVPANSPDGTTPKVDGVATIDDVDTAMVSYEWDAGDTDTAGTYWAEFEVTFSNGRARTFPAKDYLYIRVLDDLG